MPTELPVRRRVTHHEPRRPDALVVAAAVLFALLVNAATFLQPAAIEATEVQTQAI